MFKRHGLTADAYLLLPDVTPESAQLNCMNLGAPQDMAASTTTPAAELRPAVPLDDRCMPRVLQAFQQDAGKTRDQTTAIDFVKSVKQLFTNDLIAIEDMVSESYIAMVEIHHIKRIVTALRCFSTWFRSNRLTAEAYDALPDVTPTHE